jgi:hypothetical protein
VLGVVEVCLFGLAAVVRVPLQACLISPLICGVIYDVLIKGIPLFFIAILGER